MSTPVKRRRTAAAPNATPTKKRATTSPHFSGPAKGSFGPLLSATVAPHTLLLGTQPSDNSLREGKYFMTNANAFWHIVGDALGFRRGFHIDGRAEAVDFIRPHLLHDEAVDYDQAVARLTGAGYALWMFQFAGATLVASIASGAMAERVTVGGCAALTFALAGIIYPVAACVVWSPQGLLSALRHGDDGPKWFG